MRARGVLRSVVAALAYACAVQGLCQVAFPDYAIQNETWTNGTHHFQLTQGITSPGTPALPTTISGTADAEFVSGTQVHLTDGFHAGGFNGNGRFRAHIANILGTPADLVLITPDPATHIVGNMVRVNKWEKLEIGVRLPQDFQDAIDRFFANYYPNQPQNYVADPTNVDGSHDLNPYADDSLLMFVTLTDPGGNQRRKWGFYMKEAKWISQSPASFMTEDHADPLHPYHARFRIAPDMEGLWHFDLTIEAPYTTTLQNAPLLPVYHNALSFVCDAPMADNHGNLQVNVANRRNLKFEDGTPFFGIGVNMGALGGDYPQGVHDNMMESLSLMHDVGGNYVRIFLMRNIYAPEWVNLGVYDEYDYTPPQLTCGFAVSYRGNGQYNSWAFDQILQHARDNNIYIQACTDPYPPGFGNETDHWGAHPYVLNFVEASRDPQTQLMDLKTFFYDDGDPLNKDSGVFYYWKRRYKYIMARWGYSVNIAAIEPFNEVDQMLTYRAHDLTSSSQNTICPHNRLFWPEDNLLPTTVSTWAGDIADYVREPIDFNDPAGSSLGENKKLFAMSFATGDPNDAHYFAPLVNPKVDLMDVHRYYYPDYAERNLPDPGLIDLVDHALEFRTNLPSPNPIVLRKPFNHGESGHLAELDYFGVDYKIDKFLHNYDISFHNELWSSAFSGTFTTGLSWQWERVFRWPDNRLPPPDPQNTSQLGPWTNALPDPNIPNSGRNTLNLGTAQNQQPFVLVNRRIHHHIEPLRYILDHPSLNGLGFWNSEFSANKLYNTGDGVECYYLKDPSNSVAVGWVHNTSAWIMNNYYLASGADHQNFLGCIPPSVQSISLSGFIPSAEYFVIWFPTRKNSSAYPLDAQVTADPNGNVTLDFSSEPLGGMLGGYLDTLHSDYGFILAPYPVTRRMELTEEPMENLDSWDFLIYPNPARAEIFISISDTIESEVIVRDASGREVLMPIEYAGQLVRLYGEELAPGVYFVTVSNGKLSKTKKFIAQ